MRGSTAARWGLALLASILLGWIFARAALGVERIGVNALAAALAGGLAGLAFAVGSSRPAPASWTPEAGEPETPPGAKLDVLSGPLGLKDVGEIDGVQWAVRIVPDRCTVPGYAVFAVLLQNAFNKPRFVSVRVVQGPVNVEDPPRIGLKPGESGVLRIPIFLPLTLKSRSYRWEVQVQAVAPHGTGARLIDPKGSRAAASVTVQIAGSHGEPPLNLWAYDWNGFQSMHAEGQSNPDLDPWRVLEGLRSQRPEEERKAG